MATIYVDGKEYDVNGSENLLQACLSLGLDIPYFCWHPALGSVGACRQCAVKQYQNADDTRGRLVMSCMTPATEGTYISIDDEEAKQFRESVVEWLMTNHPHDCPVCEEGGNCHLQDMTVMTGHNMRKYRFTKRTHVNQDLGPFINHEMNRCIACYRCVRYYKDYADGTDLGVYGAHNYVYFGRTEDGTLESEFSGNLVEVCPTGVFTDKTHSERYNRKWDMQFAPGICQQCSLGCNTSPGERYGELRRIENRYNGSVNHYFLCDRGRFGYGYVNRKDRPRQPLLNKDGVKQVISAIEAMQSGAQIINQAKKVIGIGSPRASIESNYALRALVGEENFYSGVSADEQRRLELMQNILENGGIYTPSLREVEGYDAVLVLGEDLTQTGARMALSVRQAVKGKAREMAAAQKVADWQIAAIMNIGQHAKYPLFITNVDDTRLDDIAAFNYRAPVADQARFGFAIANMINGDAPAVADLPSELKAKVQTIADALASAKKPLIISGSHSASDAMIQAAANVAFALKAKGAQVGLSYLASHANSFGLAMMKAPSLDSAFARINADEADVAIVMENDLYRHSSVNKVDSTLAKLKHLIVVDHQHTAIMDKATLILPAASFAEADGTLINQEGRAQRFFQVFDPSFYDKAIVMNESWRWLHSLQTEAQERDADWSQLDHVIAECVNALPQFAGIVDAAPKASFRIRGQKLAREPHRYSGRTAMLANQSVHEQRQPQDKDTAFAFSMEGNNSPTAPRQQIPFAWAPGWNSPQAWNKFQSEVGGHLRFGDPGVRLFNSTESKIGYFTDIPTAYQATEAQWVVAPYYHLFGSDEMSQRSDVIQQRMPEPYIMLNAQDAATLGLAAGTKAEFSHEGQTFNLTVRVSQNLSCGQIGLPLGMPGIAPAMAGVSVNNLRRGHDGLDIPRSDGNPDFYPKVDCHPIGCCDLWGIHEFGERRILGLFQNRYGPNRVGPFGMGQLMADMFKMLFKEDWIPQFADKKIFTLAPVIAFCSLFLAFAIVPVSPTWHVADLNIGILFFLMMAGLAVYAVLFAGWSSNNKYSLLGAMRASAQTVSYEVFLGLSLMGVVAQAGSFNLIDIVNSQEGMWNVIPQFFGFVTFAIAGVAVCHRHPFDQPEAEQEIADGYHVEYSGMKFGLFFVGEYIGIVTVSALIVTLFFGGWHGPFLPSFLWFAIKTAFFMMMFILIRASLPRPRYDQVMSFGWKVCLPLTLLNLLGTAAVILYNAQ